MSDITSASPMDGTRMCRRPAVRSPGQGWRAAWAADLARAPLWLPVALGLGIWLYFSRAVEPPAWTGPICLLGPVLLWLSGLGRGSGLAGLAIGLAASAIALGFTLGDLATWRAAAPVLAHPLEATVEGRVLEVTRSAAGAPRVLLDRVTLYGTERDATPERVRVSLIAAGFDSAPHPGARIRVHARLSPPGGPVEPGAFDFRRRAYFERLGAIGYSRHPVITLTASPPGGLIDHARIWLAGRRLATADALRAAIPDAEGAFAAAIVTGDRSGIVPEDEEALRRSNLAHLLAISGLHMGLLTGLVLTASRLMLALWPQVERRWSAKKLAALAALLAGASYLALSGATVATQRAFIMVAVALVAVWLDRPAISMRALGVAASIVLILRPVSLLEVGFQMSFAATAVLIAGFEAARGRFRRSRDGAVWRRFGASVLYWVAGVAFTSLLAGLATAPYAAITFNRTAPWGFVANLAAVPAMGLVIAPSAIVAGVLAPFGLAGPPLAVMGEGIGWVLSVAHWVGALPGAVRPVRAAPDMVLVLFTAGGLWLVLWRSAWRGLGTVPVIVALTVWATAERRPDLLIAPEARLVGVMTAAGRALDSEKGQGFAAEIWLRRDGDAAEQAMAAARPGLAIGRGFTRADLANGWRVEVIRGRRPEPEQLTGLCRERTLLIARHGPKMEGSCRYFGYETLALGGAMAVWTDGDGIRIETAETPGVARPWRTPPRLHRWSDRDP